MQVRRFAALAALPVVTSLGLVACGQGGDDAAESNTSAVVSIQISEPQHLIPTNTNETSGSQVLASLFTPLVSYDADNKPVENAAESISSTDNTVWTIKLKDGFTFHNGEKVTSDSYLNAWNYGAYAPNGQGNSYFFEKVKATPTCSRWTRTTTARSPRRRRRPRRSAAWPRSTT